MGSLLLGTVSTVGVRLGIVACGDLFVGQRSNSVELPQAVIIDVVLQSFEAASELRSKIITLAEYLVNDRQLGSGRQSGIVA